MQLTDVPSILRLVKEKKNQIVTIALQVHGRGLPCFYPLLLLLSQKESTSIDVK